MKPRYIRLVFEDQWEGEFVNALSLLEVQRVAAKRYIHMNKYGYAELQKNKIDKRL